jgi:hypothetical protein
MLGASGETEREIVEICTNYIYDSPIMWAVIISITLATTLLTLKPQTQNTQV